MQEMIEKMKQSLAALPTVLEPAAASSTEVPVVDKVDVVQHATLEPPTRAKVEPTVNESGLSSAFAATPGYRLMKLLATYAACAAKIPDDTELLCKLMTAGPSAVSNAAKHHFSAEVADTIQIDNAVIECARSYIAAAFQAPGAEYIMDISIKSLRDSMRSSVSLFKTTGSYNCYSNAVVAIPLYDEVAIRNDGQHRALRHGVFEPAVHALLRLPCAGGGRRPCGQGRHQQHRLGDLRLQLPERGRHAGHLRLEPAGIDRDVAEELRLLLGAA